MSVLGKVVCVVVLLFVPAKLEAKTPAAPPASLRERLAQMRVPELQFREAVLPDVLDHLSRELHRLYGEHVNFVLLAESADSRPITMQLRDIPVVDTLQYVAQAAGLRYRVDRHAVVFVSPGAETEQMVVRTYRVYGPVFISRLSPQTLEPGLRRPEQF